MNQSTNIEPTNSGASTAHAARAVPKLAFRIDEAVFAVGISRSGIYRAINDGRLRTVKIGGRRLIPHARAVQRSLHELQG